MGNGRMGAMIYGGLSQERISLNDITLWSGEPERNHSHPDYEIHNWGNGSTLIPRIREALDSDDYPLADKLYKEFQGHFCENYQAMGTLVIDRGAEMSSTNDYFRYLDIPKAISGVSFRYNGNEYSQKCFISAPDSVLVIKLFQEDGLDLDLVLQTEHNHVISCSSGNITVDGYLPWHTYPKAHQAGENRFDPTRGIHFRMALKVVGADAEPVDGKLHISGSDNAVILLTSSSSFSGFDKDPVKEGADYKSAAVRILDKASKKSYDQLLRTHVSDYSKYFSRVKINLGKTDPSLSKRPTDEQLRLYSLEGQANPELEALYFQYGRYLLISCSRTSAVPANLQGIWNESLYPKWSSNYTTNINTEMNYWASESTGLGDMHTVLLDFILNLSKNGSVTAKEFYNVNRGWCASHNSDIWAMTMPVGLAQISPYYSPWPLAGAWLSTHIWEHYLYGRDKEALAHYFPALKGAAEFCIDFLVEKEGELITSPSTSPENSYITDTGYVGGTLYGSTADLAVIRECLTDAIASARVLEEESGFIDEAEATLSKLRSYKVGADGSLREWYYDWASRDPLHRHQSHLIGLYPGHQITSGSRLGDACAKTLEIKGFKTTGWSAAWRINLYARLHDGENAYRMFRQLLNYVDPPTSKEPNARRGAGTYSNLLNSCPPVQIDGVFGGCAGIVEMLLYSGADGTIIPLPALPEAWSNGYVKGLKTRRGTTVDIKWKNGKLKRFREYGKSVGS